VGLLEALGLAILSIVELFRNPEWYVQLTATSTLARLAKDGEWVSTNYVESAKLDMESGFVGNLRL
jgi:hypothetical protein